MWLALLLFLVLTAVVSLLNKILPFQICPVCAGVSASWLILTAAGLVGLVGLDTFQPIILLLMGGSVVGIAYQGERSFAWAGRHPLLWKTIVIGLGLPLAFGAATNAGLGVLIAEIVVLAILTYLFFVKRPDKKEAALTASPKRQEIEEKLKKCC